MRKKILGRLLLVNTLVLVFQTNANVNIKEDVTMNGELPHLTGELQFIVGR